MIKHIDFPDNSEGQLQLRSLIKSRGIVLAGNSRLRIYGRLHCRSGKRMLRKNRVFFQSTTDAIENGFRPCGHCMKVEWVEWKRETSSLPGVCQNYLNKLKNSMGKTPGAQEKHKETKGLEHK